MKNKQFTYLLLGCVVLLWGLVFFKVYAAINEEEVPIAPIRNQKTNYFNLVNHENDTVTIALGYRNPFIENGNEPAFESVQTAAPVHPLSTTIRKPVVSWAEITYKGYINNPVSKQKIAIVFINGKGTMLSEGQIANGLKLLKCLIDSIKVSYQNETKFINLK